MKPSAPAEENLFVSSWSDLADAIPVDRRTLYNFRSTRPALLKERKKDLVRAGRHSIAGWRALLSEFEVRSRGVNGNETSDDVRALVLRERLLGVEKAEFDLQKAKSLMLKVSEFEAALVGTVSNFVAALNALPGRASGKLLPRARAAVITALRNNLDAKTFKLVDAKLPKEFAIDFVDVEDTLQNEVDLVKRTLETCDYLIADPALE